MMECGYWALVELVWDQIDIYSGEDKFLHDFLTAAEAPRILFTVHWLQSEVMNGGLGQFFDNDTGVLAPEAVEGLKALGMRAAAIELSKAMKFFGDPYPRSRLARQGVFERFYEEVGADAIPLLEEEDRFAELLENENGGFWQAANRFAASA